MKAKNDIRTREQKKRDKLKIEKDYNFELHYLEREIVSKSEYAEAREKYYIRKAKEDAMETSTYDGWFLDNFISSFSQELSPLSSAGICLNNYFQEVIPKCFLSEEIIQNRKRMDDLRTAKNEAWNKMNDKKNSLFSGKEKRAYNNIYKELVLSEARGDDWVSKSEYADLLLASDSEAWENQYTPDYLLSMAIIYKLFEIRGIEPTPEAEEELKYEILESEVRKLINNKEGKFPYNTTAEDQIGRLYLTDDIRNSLLFPDIAEIYLGIANRLEVNDKYKRYSRFYTTSKDENGIIRRYEISTGYNVWNYFKKENLRELLFRVNGSLLLLDLFRYEFEKAGIYKCTEYSLGLNDYKAFCELFSYKNIIKDEKWKQYVFQRHISYLYGGEASPQKINPPLMMEALIDRTVRLKNKCEQLEKECDSSFLNSNAEYLHTKWEYYAAKLQVLLLDVRRATEMKIYDETPEKERSYEINCSEPYWRMQLGKYADNWLHSDYQIVEEYIETIEDLRPTGEFYEGIPGVIPPSEIYADYSQYGGWQSSNETYYRKQALAKEMAKINKLLVRIGDYSPIYNEDLPFKCPDEGVIKYPSHDKYDHSISLLRNKDVFYNEGNDLEKLDFKKSAGIESNIYKKGIIRFNKGYIERQDASIQAQNNKAAADNNFITSQKGYEIKDIMSELLIKGVSKEAIRKVVDGISEEYLTQKIERQIEEKNKIYFEEY